MRRRDLEVITEKIEQLEVIVSRVLSFGRSPSVMHSRWPLADTQEDTLHLLRAKLTQAGVQLRYTPLPRPVAVEVNKGQLQQVFLNLVINSLQAMPHGGKLAIECTPGAGVVHVDFSDTGGGIPPDLQPRIFESFLSGKTDGTGLGLTIARRIMQDHHGELSLVRTGPLGTTMRVTLPLPPGAA